MDPHGQFGNQAHDAVMRCAPKPRRKRVLTPCAGVLLTLLMGCGPGTSNRGQMRFILKPAVPTQATPLKRQCKTPEIALPDIPRGPNDPAVPAIVGPERLAPFFKRVARLIRGQATDHVRIAVYGDSNLTTDQLTGQLRRRLQGAYGDAGHGFVALGRPWSHYRHMDVRHDADGGYKAFAASTDPLMDRAYGIGGIAAQSRWSGATTWVATATPDAPVGHRVSQFEVFYMRGKGFGPFDVMVDGKRIERIDSHAAKKQLGMKRFKITDDAHRIAFVARSGRKPIRLLGTTLERGTPSFVIDSFGVGALNSRAMARQDQNINGAMLRHRAYDLIVLATGANDVFSLDETPKHLKRILAVHREALPQTPILILSPPDRGKKESWPLTIKVVEQRRQFAAETACAFWDQWKAMGGEGSMARFHDRKMARFDYVHLNQEGNAYVADRLLFALWQALGQYLKTHPKPGCDTSLPNTPPTSSTAPTQKN